MFEIEALSGREAVSQLFEFQLRLISPTFKEDYSGLIGSEAVIRWRFSDSSVRTIRGMLRRFGRLRADNRFDRFTAVFVPAIWTAAQNRTCWVYQQMTAPKIIESILSGSVAEYRWRAPNKTYDTRATCMQYLESNFAFAQRLMEEEGIHYYFDHAFQSKLVIGDNSSSNPMLSEPSKLRFSEVHGQTPSDGRIYSLQTFEQLTAPNIELLDHAFERTEAKIDVGVTTFPRDPNRGGIPLSEWRGFIESYGATAQRFDEYDSSGKRWPEVLNRVVAAVNDTAGLRAQLRAADFSRTVAESDYLHVAPGYRFELVDAGAADNGIYLITSVEHHYRRDGQGRWECSNRFECLRADVPYRPPLTMPRPSIRGTQSAVVVGPKEQTTFTDRYGRVKVRFHWQHDDNNNTAWVRVAQPWAGSSHGILFTPRIGHEVLIGFLNGDPDQPAVVGNLHNAANAPPYQPSANAGVTGIVSSSVSKEEASAHSSHLLFVDTPGNEQLHLHSERHSHLGVEHGMVQVIGWGPTGGGSETFAGSAPAESASKLDSVKGAIFGSGQWQAGVVQKVKGVQRYSVWGNEIDVTMGASSQFVIGAWSQARIGAGVALDVGFRTDIDVGAKFDLSIAPRCVINVGEHFDRITGSRFVKTGKDFIIEVGDDYVEQIFGKQRLVMGNGGVAERLIAESSRTSLTYDVSSFKVRAGSPKAGSPDGVEKSKIYDHFKDLRDGTWKPFEGSEDTPELQGIRLGDWFETLRDKYSINLISTFGDISVVAMGEGNSVTLFAKRINIVGKKVCVSSCTRQESDAEAAELEYAKVKKAIQSENAECNTALPALAYANVKAKVDGLTAASFIAAASAAPALAVAGFHFADRIVAAPSSDPNKWGL